MAFRYSPTTFFLLTCLVLILLPTSVNAFGAGNIPGISSVEGKNWRHGDIEDMLKTVAFLKGHKWTSMNIKRVYFGNWLRDYSQAVDVGSLKGVSAPTIRILVWVLSFLSFGYATGEFEVTEERLGVYRPEEHIDNPRGYADGLDARQYDKRLRGPIQPAELEVDHNTGMKNYIANENGGWATSTGYVRFSFERSIHFGRMYTSGSGGNAGREEDLCEALRCLGQGLHCLEDFGAHTNYCELVLREMGFDVFPHTGSQTEINLHGRQVFPLVTGTFGAVDFLHSVIGEATDHFTQTEVDELDTALKNAQQGGGDGQRGLFGSSGGGNDFISLVSKIPVQGGGLAQQARDLQAMSRDQENMVQSRSVSTRAGPMGATGNNIPGMSESFDPIKTAKQIYPILEFRDKIVKAINNTIAKIPGLESLVEKISETLSLFILSLLAPFIRPIIEAVSAQLKTGSGTVLNASANQQFEPWNDPHSTDPTHSMLSKDHFSNFLNPCAGRVAATILQYAAPRVIYAWQHPNIPVSEVTSDILRIFHHPALRSQSVSIQEDMYTTVQRWVDEQPNRHQISARLNSAAVKSGKNHKDTNSTNPHDHSHGMWGGHGKNADSIWSEIKNRDLGELNEGAPNYLNPDTRIPSPSHEPHQQNYGYSAANQQGGYASSNLAPGGASGYPGQGYPGAGGGYQQPAPQYQGGPGGYGQQPYGQGPEQGGGYGQYPPQGPPGGGYGGPPPPQGPYGAPYGQGPPPGPPGWGPPPPGPSGPDYMGGPAPFGGPGGPPPGPYGAPYGGGPQPPYGGQPGYGQYPPQGPPGGGYGGYGGGY